MKVYVQVLKIVARMGGKASSRQIIRKITSSDPRFTQRQIANLAESKLIERCPPAGGLKCQTWRVTKLGADVLRVSLKREREAKGGYFSYKMALKCVGV